jgi:two-component sensor histidine kinase
MVASNACIMLGQLLILAGLRRLFDRPLSTSRYAIIWCSSVALTMLFTFLLPSTPARVFLFSIMVSAFYIEGAALCFSARKGAPGPLAPGMATVFGFLGAFFATRAFGTVAFPQSSIFSRTWFNTVTFAVSHFGLIIWCLGLILLQNQRIGHDLERAYQEKAVLLRELQHRVKNSISVIAGLVSLESSHFEDPRVTAVLSSLQGRIVAIAQLYEQLFRTGESEEVELDVYLKSMAEALFSGQAAAKRGLRLELALESVTIDAKRAVPLGLIANELMTDSLKYAFPDGRKGSVRLALGREDEEFVLEVQDDGVGLPPDFVPGASAGLGLVLVEMLAGQVGGALSYPSPGEEAGPARGERFAVRFPAAISS